MVLNVSPAAALAVCQVPAGTGWDSGMTGWATEAQPCVDRHAASAFGPWEKVGTPNGSMDGKQRTPCTGECEEVSTHANHQTHRSGAGCMLAGCCVSIVGAP